MKSLARISLILLCAGSLISGQANSQGNHSVFNEFRYAKPTEMQLDSLNVRCVGRALYGQCHAVCAEGDYAYVGAGSCFLIFDITRASGPTLVGKTYTPGLIYGIRLRSGHAYVADYEDGLRVIDISNPSNPHEVGSCDTESHALDVFVSGIYAYLASSEAGLRIINIADPSNPYEAGFYDTGHLCICGRLL
ncbi:MAG: LVIVD repeat-containing protein [Candidatus Zixiibacteriota bacterium]